MSNLLFSFQSLLHKNFLETDLGALYQSVPFEAIAEAIPKPASAKSNLGCKPWFDVKGGIGLLILKHYTGLSDALLMERINTDWAMQLFCGILLKPGQQIKDTNQTRLLENLYRSAPGHKCATKKNRRLLETVDTEKMDWYAGCHLL